MEEVDKLAAVIQQLRSPDGCPWDKEQTHESLKPYLIEEVYEVIEAIDRNSPELLKEELGDLLLQIVLHAQIAAEKKEFDLAEVARLISEKMIRRHPHVFAKTKVNNVNEVWQNWEKIKKTEKPAQKDKPKSILDSVPDALPALFRASKIQKKAARVGFDWPDTKPVLDKIKEEINEFENIADKQQQIDEFGDILFSLVNLSRKINIDAEDALRLAVKKFENRFKFIEKKIDASGKDFKDFSLEELDKWWTEAKHK